MAQATAAKAAVLVPNQSPCFDVMPYGAVKVPSKKIEEEIAQPDVHGPIQPVFRSHCVDDFLCGIIACQQFHRVAQHVDSKEEQDHQAHNYENRVAQAPDHVVAQGGSSLPSTTGDFGGDLGLPRVPITRYYDRKGHASFRNNRAPRDSQGTVFSVTSA